jgi:hypothetical protein
MVLGLVVVCLRVVIAFCLAAIRSTWVSTTSGGTQVCLVFVGPVRVLVRRSSAMRVSVYSRTGCTPCSGWGTAVVASVAVDVGSLVRLKGFHLGRVGSS